LLLASRWSSLGQRHTIGGTLGGAAVVGVAVLLGPLVVVPSLGRLVRVRLRVVRLVLPCLGLEVVQRAEFCRKQLLQLQG
jgi:hypothetical protein